MLGRRGRRRHNILQPQLKKFTQSVITLLSCYREFQGYSDPAMMNVLPKLNCLNQSNSVDKDIIIMQKLPPNSFQVST